MLRELADEAGQRLAEQGLPREQQTVGYQVDVRYHGQGFEIPVDVDDPATPTWPALGERFDAEHNRLFSFLLDVDHEIVNARATVTGPKPDVAPVTLAEGDGDPSGARVQEHEIYVGGEHVPAGVYDRAKLRAGDVVARSGDRHRDGLHDPRPARARGHRARLGLAC